MGKTNATGQSCATHMGITQIFVLTICVSGSLATLTDGFSCPGSRIDPYFLERIVDYHNRVRVKIAIGMEKNHTGKLATAKNMYEMSWDCELEKLAEQIADDEDFDLESIYPRSANVDHRSHCPNFEVDYHTVFKKSLDRWWFEIREFGQTSPENLYSDDSIEHFANMAVGRNTKLGCSYHRRGRAARTVCVYDIAPEWNKPIYELGKRCKKDTDCKTYPGSICDTLCVKK